MRHPRFALSVVLPMLGVVTSCSGGDSTTSETSALSIKLEKIWPQHQIPVCFNMPGRNDEKLWIRQAIKGQRSWEYAGDVSFQGWTNCESSIQGIEIKEAIPGDPSHFYTQTDYLADGVTHATIYLDFNGWANYDVCAVQGLTYEQCVKYFALHEFGHAIGLQHEQNRSDFDWFNDDCGGFPSDIPGISGTWRSFPLQASTVPQDDASIMAYCWHSDRLSQYDRLGLRRFYGEPNIDPPRLEDFDGDRKADLLCFDPTTGTKWIDYASTPFNGTEWTGTHASFCTGSSKRLFKGRFQLPYFGQGRTDLLCHDLATGSEIVQRTDSSGHPFGFTLRSGTFCAQDYGVMLIGNFDGSAMSDQLCYNRNGTNSISVAFNGVLTSPWTGTLSGFYPDPKSALMVGDFNGDGWEDILWFLYDYGPVAIYFNSQNAASPFGPIGWLAGGPWCSGEADEAFVGLFNDDYRADLLCHNTYTGQRAVVTASATGALGATYWYSGVDGWCTSSTSRSYVGDFNDDARDDLFCFDSYYGWRHIDYADAAGHFDGTDWGNGSPDGWCTHDAAQLH